MTCTTHRASDPLTRFRPHNAAHGECPMKGLAYGRQRMTAIILICPSHSSSKELSECETQQLLLIKRLGFPSFAFEWLCFWRFGNHSERVHGFLYLGGREGWCFSFLVETVTKCAGTCSRFPRPHGSQDELYEDSCFGGPQKANTMSVKNSVLKRALSAVASHPRTCKVYERSFGCRNSVG